MGVSNGVMRKILLSYTYVGIWILLSSTVILYNKYILDPKLYNWPYPISLTLIHMASCSALSFVAVRLLRLSDPPPSLSRRLYLTSVVPIAALYSLSLWLSNSAYVFLSVSFIQMLKALTPVAVYSASILLRNDSLRRRTLATMLSISLGVAISAYGESKFHPWGVFLQITAVLFEATRLVMIQILLTSKGIALNPLTSLYYVSPCCFLFLLIPWFFVECRPNSIFRFSISSISYLDVAIFGTNSMCALGLNLAVFLLVGKTSALTMNVAGVVKDWLLIAVSWSVIKDRVTPLNLLGYGLAFLGVAYYNHCKLQGLKAKEAQRMMMKVGDEEEGGKKKTMMKLLDDDDDDDDRKGWDDGMGKKSDDRAEA